MTSNDADRKNRSETRTSAVKAKVAVTTEVLSRPMKSVRRNWGRLDLGIRQKICQVMSIVVVLAAAAGGVIFLLKLTSVRSAPPFGAADCHWSQCGLLGFSTGRLLPESPPKRVPQLPIVCGITAEPESTIAQPVIDHPSPPPLGWQWVTGPMGMPPILIVPGDVGMWWNLYPTADRKDCYIFVLEKEPLIRA